MIRRIAGIVVALTLLLAPFGWAHEGHTRKVMGTVTMIAPDHVMVKTTAGKEHTITLKADTKILRGTTKVKTDQIKEGSRVVITAVGDKEPYAAKEIKVGSVTKSAPPAAAKKVK